VELHRIGRVLEIGEARDQAGGGPHASGGKGAFHHHGVGRPFAAVVVVGDDENLLGALRHSPGTVHPGHKLRHRVEVIVAGASGLSPSDGRPRLLLPGKPGSGISAVQANVGDKGCDVFGRSQSGPQRRLIDVAEADAQLPQEVERPIVVPRAMPELRHQRETGQEPDQAGQVAPAVGPVVEGVRELHQDGTQSSGPAQRVDASEIDPGLRAQIHIADPFGGRRRPGRSGGARGRPERPRRCPAVGQGLIQLRREQERRTGWRTITPGNRRPWIDLPVKGHIDLDDIEKIGQKSEAIEAPGERRWIDDPCPVPIIPACDADAYHRRLMVMIDLRPNFC